MAEEEVVKHTKKVYKIWNSKDHSFWEKVREFTLEILIIVFAVTISISLHSWNEHRREQADVKEFLFGLREDLKGDIVEMRNDINSYKRQGQAFKYVMAVKVPANFDDDSLKTYANAILKSSTALLPNNGRFEGFKSSGKVGSIENYDLQNDIMDLYQEAIPSLLTTTSYYIETKKEFWRFLRAHVDDLNGSPANLRTALLQTEARNISALLAYPNEVIARYDNCVNKMVRIIDVIDSTYGKHR